MKEAKEIEEFYRTAGIIKRANRRRQMMTVWHWMGLCLFVAFAISTLMFFLEGEGSLLQKMHSFQGVSAILVTGCTFGLWMWARKRDNDEKHKYLPNFQARTELKNSWD